ncbi:MAG: MoxR family ATPase [Nitrospirota bacterium]|nr:MoxR family ATPase [Nitrospirota bacterium]MDH5586363.1 MoxR family ATPase [Nitrospirota bacterium]MDH5775190.1 MoxR family ATPase [Nitrospirota bacterium]
MPFPFITGTAIQPPAQPVELPQPSKAKQLDPAGYRMEQPLVDAVNVAILLSQPLLLTGDPGTGKTQLAYRVAWELGLGEPIRFDTKSTSTARDVLYRYDTLSRFHAAQTNTGSQHNLHYLDYVALGQAIILSRKPEEVMNLLPPGFRHPGPRRSVVLVDEIDKASRDFPNDLLLEVDALQFRIPELNEEVKANPELRPVLILTSNSEQNLPDAFLRRCIYYHIPLPDRHRLAEIVRNRVPGICQGQDNSLLLDSALDMFEEVRKLDLRKKPSTAELLNWLQVLEGYGAKPEEPVKAASDALRNSLSALAKTKEDRPRLMDWVEKTVLASS